MEPRFGRNFAHVRVHADSQAVRSAEAVGASAYTVGRDIVFGHGQFAPHSAPGQRLLAHELAHTIQQSGGASIGGELRVGAQDDPLERDAERVSASVLSGQSRPAGGKSVPPTLRLNTSSIVQRQPSPPPADQKKRSKKRRTEGKAACSISACRVAHASQIVVKNAAALRSPTCIQCGIP